LDEIVIFDPLSHEQLRKVARLQMKDVAVRLAERGIALAVTDAALDVILSLSYDPVCGSFKYPFNRKKTSIYIFCSRGF
jgi:ATP-dependent Clp protease ATP-binding subunit ClpB